MKLFIVVLVTAVIGTLAYFAVFYTVRDVFRQHFAESYSHVRGAVISSTVTTTRGSKGAVYYHPQITYRYTADGLEYTGNRYRYDGHPTGSSAAYAIVNSHPPGSTVDVYYNPADGTDALLSPGVDTQDMVLGFFIPAVFLFLFLLPLKSAQQPGLPWTGPEATGGVKVITDMTVTRLRMPRYQPLAVAMVTVSLLMFLAAAVVGLGLLSTPLWVTGESAMVIALIGGAAAYAWQYMDLQSGKRDLVIDEGARTVQLPLTYGRRDQTPVPISQIRSVLLNKVRHRTKNGVYYSYAVTLEMADGPEQKLIDLNITRANSLGTWLKEKMGLPERLVEPAED